jgi:hypothetical protein
VRSHRQVLYRVVRFCQGRNFIVLIIVLKYLRLALRSIWRALARRWLNRLMVRLMLW